MIIINQSIKEVESIAQMIARDIQSDALKKEDINSVLDKAIEFYAEKEDYDLCQIVKNLKL